MTLPLNRPLSRTTFACPSATASTGLCALDYKKAAGEASMHTWTHIIPNHFASEVKCSSKEKPICFSIFVVYYAMITLTMMKGKASETLVWSSLNAMCAVWMSCLAILMWAITCVTKGSRPLVGSIALPFSPKMRQKRAKAYRKLMHLYCQSFGFRQPYQILGQFVF